MAPELAFIGSGRMARALVRGILASGKWSPANIRCTGARDGTAEALAEACGIQSTYDYDVLLAEASWIILACKPQQLDELPPLLADSCKDKNLLSILAGTSLDRLKTRFPLAANIVRAMPNTPGMIGEGISAYASLRPLSKTGEATVTDILGALGRVLPLPEEQLNAVTGVSGSGPAYVFEFVAALRDGGIAAGLDPQTAYTLALQTVKGAATLLEAVPETPETHRDWVSSPGGTTLAGLKVMEERGLRETIKATVLAAQRRAEELS